MSLTVLVGATGALGGAIADRLVSEGHHVVAVARDEQRLRALVERHGDRASACPADISRDASVDAIAGAVGERTVRMVVHCGAAPLGQDVLEVDRSEILHAVDVKVGGLLRLVEATRARLGAGSRVVAVGGSLAYDPTPDAPTAGVANAALANLVRQLSRALGPSGVTCHVVAPGPVLTERFLRVAEAEARRTGTTLEETLARTASSAATGTLTTPEQVGWAVARLADPEAAALTGGTLLLDAGRRTSIP